MDVKVKCTSSGLLTVAGLLNVAEAAGGAAIKDSSSAEVITPPEGGGLRSHEFFESFKMLKCEI